MGTIKSYCFFCPAIVTSFAFATDWCAWLLFGKVVNKSSGIASITYSLNTDTRHTCYVWNWDSSKGAACRLFPRVSCSWEALDGAAIRISMRLHSPMLLMRLECGWDLGLAV